MALSSSRRLLLLLSLVAATTAVTCATSEVIVTRCCSTSEVIVIRCCSTSEVIVTRCYPPPTPTVNGSGSLLSLVDALPSAAARTGFASLWTGGAIVRGFCFGDTAPDPCLRCLSDAGRKIADQCGGAGGRAGFLNDGCFMGYADASADDDDIGAVTFSGDAAPRLDAAGVQKLVAVAQSLVPRSASCQVASANATTTASTGDTVRVLAQCAPDRDAAECARCVRDSALKMAKSWGATAGAAQGSVATILGSNCYLPFQISAPPLPVAEQIRETVKDNIALTVCIAIALMLPSRGCHHASSSLRLRHVGWA